MIGTSKVSGEHFCNNEILSKYAAYLWETEHLCNLGTREHRACKTSYLTTCFQSFTHWPRVFLVTTWLSTFFGNNAYSEKNSPNKCMLKFSKRQTRIRCELFSFLARKISEWCLWHFLDVFNANYKYISHHFLVFLLLTVTSVEQYIKTSRNTAVALFSIWKMWIVFVIF